MLLGYAFFIHAWPSFAKSRKQTCPCFNIFRQKYYIRCLGVLFLLFKTLLNYVNSFLPSTLYTAVIFMSTPLYIYMYRIVLCICFCITRLTGWKKRCSKQDNVKCGELNCRNAHPTQFIQMTSVRCTANPRYSELRLKRKPR